MSRIVRALLVWVMVIAMPVQGMAASMMLFCGPGHESAMQGLAHVAPAPHADHAGAHVHDHAAAAHDHGMWEAITDAPPSPDTASAELVVQQHGKYGCSACAACCIMLALPAGLSLPPDPGRAHPVLTSPSAPLPSHQPDGLDRPPRPALA